jgi:hypothetical protein
MHHEPKKRQRVKAAILALTATLVLFTGKQTMAVDEPKYTVIDEFDGVEVRRVSAYWLVEIEIESPESEAGNQAFRPLFKYISGENRASEKISMTAPVNQQATGEKISMTAPVNQVKTGVQKFAVSFVLPEEFNRRPPPLPLDSRLKLRHVAERAVAIIRYRGTWSAERMAEKRDALLAALATNARWKPVGAPIWSRFDPPFMPWFLRRNEVQIEVKQ